MSKMAYEYEDVIDKYKQLANSQAEIIAELRNELKESNVRLARAESVIERFLAHETLPTKVLVSDG